MSRPFKCSFHPLLIVLATLTLAPSCRDVFPFKDPGLMDGNKPADGGKLVDGTKFTDASSDSTPTQKDASADASSPLSNLPFKCAADDTPCPNSLGVFSPDHRCCGGNCLDISKNKEHCGECGRNCEGEPCNDSQCEPTQVFEADYLSGIAMDQDWIYFTQRVTNHRVGRLNKLAAGLQMEQTLASGLSDPYALEVDSTHLFWAGDDGVSRRSIDPAQTAIKKISDQQGHRIALNDSSVFWAITGNIFTATKDGTDEELLVQNNTSQFFAVDNDAVYYRQQYGLNGIILRQILNGSLEEIAIQEDQGTGGLAVHGSWLYWINSISGQVRMAPVDGSAGLTTLVPNLFSPLMIAADQTHVYFSDFSRQLQRKSLSVGFAELIHPGEEDDLILEILVDDHHVVWLVHRGALEPAQIWKMVK